MWLLYLPLAQALHREAPEDDEVPGGHARQVVWPELGL